MTVQPRYSAQLKAPALQPACHNLATHRSTVIGRDPDCQIALDAEQYQDISRRHAEIHPPTGQSLSWQICDLGSVNGTYLNGQRLQNCQVLQNGDRILLGATGVDLLFECRPAQPTAGESLAATVYDGAPPRANSGMAHSAPAQTGTAPWKVICWVLAALFGLTLLNSIQSRPSQRAANDNPPVSQASPDASPPASPAPASPASPSAPRASAGSGLDAMKPYFELGEPEVKENATIRDVATGKTVKADVLVMKVTAKSSFSHRDVQFVARFLDAEGQEISPPSEVFYDPLPERWKAGTESQAVFALPDNRQGIQNIVVTSA